MFPASNVSKDTHLWQKLYCETTMTALCQNHSKGKFEVFPTNSNIFISQQQTQAFNESNTFLKSFPQDSACNRSDTGRLLQADSNQYAMTLCDIIDANLDLIIELQESEDADMTIYWRQDETSVWLLVFLAMVSIYLVSCVAQNIVAVIRNEPNTSWRHTAQYFVTLLVIIALLYDFFGNGLFLCLVLLSDKRLLIHILIYVIIEWIWQVLVRMRKLPELAHHEHFASTVSILTATLLLISARIHLTFDNPYVVVLTGLFGVRTCYKSLWLGLHKMHTVQHAMQIVDLFVFCSLLGNGIMPASSSVIDGTLMQLFLVFIAYLLAAILVLYKIVTSVPENLDSNAHMAYM
jgi:hypothetical protein